MIKGLARMKRHLCEIRDHRPRTGPAGRLYSIVMKSFKNLVCVLTLLVLLAESSSLFAQAPPTIAECAREWELTAVQDMNFGAFSAEPGSATITMNSTGGLATSGPVSLLTTVPVTTGIGNIDNVLGPDCATYGFTLDLRRAPRPLRAPGGNIPLSNIRVTIPAYGLNNVTLPQVITGNILPFTMTVYGEIEVTGPQAAGEYSVWLIAEARQVNRRSRLRIRVRATSIVPLSIAEIAAMDFGTIAGGSFPGTVILDTGNGRIATGDAQLLASGPGNAAIFQFTGEPNSAYSLSFSNGFLANATGQQMSVTTFTNNSTGTIPGSGTDSFQVGATLNVGSGQQSGSYSTSIGGGSPYTVTINYN
jgi:hypothetical protein